MPISQTYHAAFDFDRLWSQYQVYKRALVTWPVWGQRSRRGHRGEKCHLHQKCYFSCRLHGMVLWLMHIHQLNTTTKPIGTKIDMGSVDVTWVKRSFSPKMLCLLQITWYGSVTHTFPSARHPYNSCRLKFKFGVIWGYWGQKVIFTKNAITSLYYIAWQ